MSKATVRRCVDCQSSMLFEHEADRRCRDCREKQGRTIRRQDGMSAVLAAEVERERDQLLDEAEQGPPCLAEGHTHRTRAGEAICALTFQRDQLRAKLKLEAR